LAESFDETRSFTIVGVVGSVLQNDLTEGPSAGAVYLPYRHDTSSGAAFHVMLRTKTDPSLFYSSLRRIVWNHDPELPVNDLRSLQDRLDDVLTLRRLSALIVGVYAAAALLLAALGLYGTMSCLVSQRTNEFGIRMAMGASRREVQKRVIATGCTVALSGLALGLPCALASARLISGMIFGISVHDPATFVIVSFFLICVMLIACTIPAVRAARIDPWKALQDT
jgi:putative ABC transport system permease protein